MKTKLLSLCLALICATQLFAYDCKINGIYYNLNRTNKTAEVTKGDGSYSSSLPGWVDIPASITYNSQTYSVTTIGYEAFSSCSGLTKVTIPNSVTTIGSSAFYGCSGLTSVTIPNSVTTIGDCAFKACRALFSVTIPNSVTMIGDYAFAGCSGLTRPEYNANCFAYLPTSYQGGYTIPDGITQIAGGAFSGCRYLTDITIPNSVTTIGNAAFNGCGLTSLVYNANCFAYMPTSYQGAYTIPNGITQIAGSAFRNCRSLTSITIPNSVTTIGDSAFYRCRGLTSVTIPNSVTTIGKFAFCECSGLTSITIPNSVTTIGSSAFSWCNGLTSVTIPNSVTTIGGFAFDGCKGLTKTNYTGTIADWCKIKFGGFNANPMYFSHNFYINDVEVKDIVIPEGIDTIGGFAFDGCSGLTSVTIPNSVTTIGEYAFEYCSGLTSVTIPNSVTTIGNNAFKDCSGLTSVMIGNSVTTIGNMAFYGCSCLTSVTIPNSVTTIGSSAFSGCSGLTSVTIGNSVITIGDYAFNGCTNLKTIINGSNLSITKGSTGYGYVAYYADKVYNGIPIGDFLIKQDTLLTGYIGDGGDVTIPNGITVIGNSAFANCSTLTSVVIPNSVETIGGSAFANCTYLADVVIGANVTEIGCNAFAGDTRIENITCYAPITPNVCSTTFDKLNKWVVYLYVPADYQRKYQVDPNWSGFSLHLIGAEQKPIIGDEVTVVPSTDNATFIWPSNDQADSYSLEITKDGAVFCTLTFNAQGQLMGIAFAAGRGHTAMAHAATSTNAGWKFTVTGLNQASKYAYTLDALNASQQSIKHYQGEFATDGYTDLLPLPYEGKDGEGSSKFIHNGRLLIERNGIRYNAHGARVK